MKNSILVIMAGGKSSRMQTDKALLPFDGYGSLAEYQYKRFQDDFFEIYISAKNNKFDFHPKIVQDAYQTSSPLVALVSIFKSLDLEEVVVLSVDSPFVTREILKKLLSEARDDSLAIVAESTNGLEPLCAIYRRGILVTAEAMLDSNQHRLQMLLESVKTQKVLFKDSKSFMNLNYPLEYALAKTLSSNI
jgi:molybdopterin-guanine dinucleotide biosynthesis protein A